METLRAGSLPDGREFEIRAGLLAGGFWEAWFVCVPAMSRGTAPRSPSLKVTDTLDELRGWVEKLDPEDIQQIAEKYSAVEGLGRRLDDDLLIPPT